MFNDSGIDLTPNNALDLIRASLERLTQIEQLERAIHKPLESVPLLLDYQKAWVSAGFTAKVAIIAKSRRIGLSWCDAVISVLKAATMRGGNSTFYISYNKEMTSQYIEDCAFWAKAFNIVGVRIKQRILHDEGKDILISRIKFASGHRIVALSSKPKNLRSKKGDLVFDEYAFTENPEELMKAGLALIIWGGSVRIISTHCGVDSYFNQIIKEIKEGKKKYCYQKVTFQQAIAAGLYKRICLLSREDWSEEKEESWKQGIYDFYGFGATEELDCIPSEGKNAGEVFNRVHFKIVSAPPCEPWVKVRAWDLAGTRNEPMEDAFYTVGTLLYLCGDVIIVADWVAAQVSISDGDDLIEQTAIADGYDTTVVLEREPADAGHRFVASMEERLTGFVVTGIAPRSNKIIRCLPIAHEARRGNVYLLEAPWNEAFLNAVHRVSDKKVPLITDTADSLSLGYTAIKATISPFLGT